jgi:two-component system, sensor histidine kinase and response regulator
MIKTYKRLLEKTSNIGLDNTLTNYAKKRLLIFNRLNLIGLLLAICWFLYHLIIFEKNNIVFSFLSIMPFVIVMESFFLMYIKKYKAAIYTNFIFIPLILTITSIQMNEGTVLMYLIIYSIFPFFYNRNFKTILIQYIYIISLYACSLYFFIDNIIGTSIVFSPLFQGIGIVFLFLTLYSIKTQIMALEKQMQDGKVALDLKNKELNELLSLKNKVFSVISHDIIVPLVGLKQLTESITNEDLNSSEIKGMFNAMNDEIVKTHGMFTNLLDWSKSQLNGSGFLTTDNLIYNVANTAIEQIKKQATDKKITIINNIDKDLLAHVNQQNILATTRNLLTNAVKFTQLGGLITLSSATTEKEVKIFINDTGIGIEDEKMVNLFGSEFYTSQGTNAETGNGFGLKICKELMQQNGGTVYCENSTPGIGSTFVIKLAKAKFLTDYVIDENEISLN